MESQIKKNSLIEDFEKLPIQIKNWLFSDQIMAIKQSLNEFLEMEGGAVKIIPVLIGKICIGNLKPERLTEEMSNYGFEQKEIEYCVREIKEKIFRPIAAELLKVGVDINKIGMPVDTKQEAGSGKREAGIMKYESGSMNNETRNINPVQQIKPFIPSIPQQQKQFVRREITLDGKAASATGYGEPKQELGIMNQGTNGIEKFRPEIASLPAGDRNDKFRDETRNDAIIHPKPFILHEEKAVAPPQVPTLPKPVQKPEIKQDQEVRIPIKRN